MDEIWKEIDKFPYYQISTRGRIRRTIFVNGHCHIELSKPRYLKPTLTRLGYLTVTLSHKAKIRRVFLHRLVAEAFLGDCPEGMEVAHLDGKRANCELINLKWATRKENHSHKKIHGTQQCNERNPFSKLKNAEVKKIKEMLYDGTSGRELAKKYSVSEQCISDIKLGKRWNSI